jgi:transcriptional regulator with XRE-family HTH domain
MTTIPVKGSVLKWPRKYRGLDVRGAARELGISEDDLLAYEDERRVPTLTVFENFAAKYRLPQATLFLAAAPETPPDPQDFRTLEGLSPHKTFDFRVALSNVRTLLFYAERTALEDEELLGADLQYCRQVQEGLDLVKANASH